jgi:hypothetical protein
MSGRYGGPRSVRAVQYAGNGWNSESVAEVVRLIAGMPDDQPVDSATVVDYVSPIGDWNPPELADLAIGSQLLRPGDWVVLAPDGAAVTLIPFAFERLFRPHFVDEKNPAVSRS